MFRKSSIARIDAAWWQSADAAAVALSSDAIDQLARTMAPASTAPDEAERQEEMLAGLRDLADLAAAATLPALATQHRVIGADRCHLIAPVSRGADAGAAGKLFLTSARLVVVGGRSTAWPWHRVRRVTRAGRDVVVIVTGEADPLLLRCNTYGDALAAHYIAGRLRSGAGC